MGFIQNLTTLIRETLNLNGHIDTDTAERTIRNNIEFKGPNAWILAVAEEQEIRLLKNELDKLKSNSLEYDKISKEIFSIKSSVTDVIIAKGHSFRRDTTVCDEIIYVAVSTVDSIATSEVDELREWLKVRLDTDAIEVLQR